MRTKTHPRYIDGHAYETPRTAFRHQLLLTFAALLILSGTSALIGIAHAMRRALALGTAPAPRADDFPSWTAWVLGAGSWWPALASAGLFVTVQLVATPHLRTAGSSEESFRNRFSSAMQLIAAFTTASWVLSLVAVLVDFVMDPHSAIQNAAIPMLFTGVAAWLCFYLGGELRMHFGSHRMRELRRSFATATLEARSRRMDFPSVARQQARRRIWVALLAFSVLTVLIGVGVGLALAPVHPGAIIGNMAFAALCVVMVAYTTSFLAQTANSLVSRPFGTATAVTMACAMTPLFGISVTWLAWPVAGTSLAGAAWVATGAMAAMIGLNVAVYVRARTHRNGPSPLSWLLPGAILLSEAASAEARLIRLQTAIGEEERRARRSVALADQRP